MDRLNFNHLFYFYIIAKEGSIKAAAEKLHVSQPTISDQLKLVESYFECKLFERKNRGLFLTHEGKLALEYAEKIFGLSSEMTQALRNKNLQPKKSVDIGITHHLSPYFLYDQLLPLFKQSDISVNIKQSERHYLLADLEEGELDIVFTNSKESLSKSMTAYQVGLNRTFIVAHKKFGITKKSFPENLNEIPFFNYTENSFLKYEIELFLAKNNIRPKTIGSADDIDMLELVTKQGLAFTIVPEVAKKRFCANKNIVALAEIKDLQTSIWAITASNYSGIGKTILNSTLWEN